MSSRRRRLRPRGSSSWGRARQHPARPRLEVAAVARAARLAAVHDVVVALVVARAEARDAHVEDSPVWHVRHRYATAPASQTCVHGAPAEEAAARRCARYASWPPGWSPAIAGSIVSRSAASGFGGMGSGKARGEGGASSATRRRVVREPRRKKRGDAEGGRGRATRRTGSDGAEPVSVHEALGHLAVVARRHVPRERGVAIRLGHGASASARGGRDRLTERASARDATMTTTATMSENQQPVVIRRERAGSGRRASAATGRVGGRDDARSSPRDSRWLSRDAGDRIRVSYHTSRDARARVGAVPRSRSLVVGAIRVPPCRRSSGPRSRTGGSPRAGFPTRENPRRRTPRARG